jgi:3-deoxy-manno-octulosonate cytidylyltransferase (CMP-KDO synthetase)
MAGFQDPPMGEQVSVVIPARLASTRLAGKMLLDLCGKPVLRHVLDRAMGLPATEVVVLTESPLVRDAVESWGGTCLLTSDKCQSGTARIAEALPKLRGDFVLNIQGDEPFFDAALAARMLTDRPAVPFDMLTPVYPLRDRDALRNPNVVKVVLCHSGRAIYFSRSPIPFLRSVPEERWCESHAYWGHLGVYLYPRRTLELLPSLPGSPLAVAESLEQLQLIQAELVVQTVRADHPTIAIDTADDLARAKEYYLQHGQGRA